MMFYIVDADFSITTGIDICACSYDPTACVDGLAGECRTDGCDKI